MVRRGTARQRIRWDGKRARAAVASMGAHQPSRKRLLLLLTGYIQLLPTPRPAFFMVGWRISFLLSICGQQFRSFPSWKFVFAVTANNELEPRSLKLGSAVAHS